MFLLDRFFDGTFFTYGIEVMSFADRDQVRFNDAICLPSIGLYRLLSACIGLYLKASACINTRYQLVLACTGRYLKVLVGISRMYQLVWVGISKWFGISRMNHQVSACIGRYRLVLA